MDIRDEDSKPAKTVAPEQVALDGGYGWIIVAASFLAYFIADGWAYSFGIFYPEILAVFGEGKGKTALIGALLYGVPLLISPLICALTSIYGCRKVAMAGGLITGTSAQQEIAANSAVLGAGRIAYLEAELRQAKVCLVNY